MPTRPSLIATGFSIAVLPLAQVRVIGPLSPSDVVEGVWLHGLLVGGLGVLGVAVGAVGNRDAIDESSGVWFTPTLPPAGGFVFGGGAVGSASGVVSAFLPCGFAVSPEFRFLAVRVEVLAGDSFDGSAWLSLRVSGAVDSAVSRLKGTSKRAVAEAVSRGEDIKPGPHRGGLAGFGFNDG